MKVGILGDGQLARFLSLAAYAIGLDVAIYSSANSLATQGLTANYYNGSLDDNAQLRAFFNDCDVVTYETENIPEAVQGLFPLTKIVMPPRLALQTAQDRLLEKKLFTELNLATNQYQAVDTAAELQAAVAKLGLPLLLKQRRQAYDGRGQIWLRSQADVSQQLKRDCRNLLAEQAVNFTREFSIIGVRRANGEVCFYDLCENTHQQGILIKTFVRHNDPLQAQAEAYLQKLFAHFNYVGVLTLECFVENGQLLCNELAPRVHNSGHWTVNGALTSHFENHIRAVCDLPLGQPTSLGHVAMCNLIGRLPDPQVALRIPGTFIADYKKIERAGRKLGHLNMVAQSAEELTTHWQHFMKQYQALL